MKKKYIVGLVIAGLFIVLAIYSFDANRTEYADIESARKSGKTVQLFGSRDSDRGFDYNPEKDLLTFYMSDSLGAETKVIYKGSPPNNFDIAPSLVVKGKFENDDFIAVQILTKCPSKYNSDNPALLEGKVETDS